MKSDKMVWVEMDFSRVWQPGFAVRIFKNRSAASKFKDQRFVSPRKYSEAVGEVRHHLWLRCKGECELCAAPVTEQSGHMHEQVHRGKGGEISLANSVFICPKCHQRAHSARNPRFTKKSIDILE
jgi:5-methylcytosine-specific restriction endonuclease McrA